ncbi:MAG: SDR family NAD(P)-dependent oxidoreductase, partial [Planctomycetota bacterium]
GAARNVGKGVALRLASEGARVIANDIDGEALAALVANWESDGLAVSAAVADVSDPEAMGAVVEDAVAQFGSLDILINNAVVHPRKGERGVFLKVSDEGWRDFMARNLDALFFTTRCAAEVMARKRRGSIINISSNGAAQAHRQRIAYDTLKGAVESFTRAVAVDLAPWGVRVNAIRPIAVRETPAPGSDAEALVARLSEMVPLGRIARPADIGALAAFLASDDSEFITGQVINVDGGMLEQSRPPQLELEPVEKPDEQVL